MALKSKEEFQGALRVPISLTLMLFLDVFFTLIDKHQVEEIAITPRKYRLFIPVLSLFH